jgi:hypothetical protein
LVIAPSRSLPPQASIPTRHRGSFSKNASSRDLGSFRWIRTAPSASIP